MEPSPMAVATRLTDPLRTSPTQKIPGRLVSRLRELPPPGAQLTEKVRRGARITRRYDVAQTPYRRLLASSVLPRKTERQLTFRWAAVHPLRLKLEIESAQRTLAERGVRPVIAHPLRSEEL